MGLKPICKPGCIKPDGNGIYPDGDGIKPDGDGIRPIFIGDLPGI